MAAHLRRHANVIDRETERAVAAWVRLGDQTSGRPTPDGRTSCARCGSRDFVLDRGKEALCARCFLESEEPATGQSKAEATAEASA